MKLNRARNALLAYLLLVMATQPGFAQGDPVSVVRGQLRDLGKFMIQRETGQLQRNPSQKRSPADEIIFQLGKVPDEVLLTALDQSLKMGNREERIGAAIEYSNLMQIDVWKRRKLAPIPEYKALLIDHLEKDDLTLPSYTRYIAFPLQDYPSREVVLALMSAAQRTSVPQIRETLIDYASQMVGMYLELDPSRPVEKEMLLSGFEAWFAKNKDKIRFDKHGRYHLAGKEVSEKNNVLTSEDRTRIRRDPLCVLRLLDSGMGGDDVGGEDLSQRCGVALLGPEAAELLKKPAAATDGTGSTSIELRAAIGSARYTYPIFNAAALASIYVATYEKDPQAISLAKEILGQLPAADLDKVIKGEPKEVRKKAKELEAELLKDRED